MPRLAAYGVAAFGFVTAGFAADTHVVHLAQANRCAIYGSGFVATTDGGCARIGGRVRVQRRVDQRTPIAAPPASMGVPMGMPMTNGFQFSGGQRDGPNRAHLRLPSETNNVFAPSFR